MGRNLFIRQSDQSKVYHEIRNLRDISLEEPSNLLTAFFMF